MYGEVIYNNEKIFADRFGLSMEDKWRALTETERINATRSLFYFDQEIKRGTLEFENEDILRIVIGFSGRSGLEKIMGNSIPTLKVVIWEPDEVLFEAYCTQTDISDFLKDERLLIVLGEDIFLLENKLIEIVSENNAFHSKIMAYGRYADQSDRHVEQLVSILGRVANDATQDGYSRKQFHTMPCENLLYTIYTLSNNYIIQQLFDAIPTRDIPIIIVSAGPSLMKNYKELKRAKGRAVIIAVSHAAKTLADADITPDLVAVTDASGTNYMDFDKDRKHTLICSVYADKKCRSEYNGKVIYHGFTMVNHLFISDRTMTEKYAELDTGSVATDIFSLVLSAGFKRIILIGQDLAYDDEGYTHTGYYKENDSSAFHRLQTEGLNGELVQTRDDWLRFKKFFEKKIGEYKETDVIDSTEGGALIKGTRVMKLSDAIDMYCSTEYSVEAWIKGLKKGNENERHFIKQWFDTIVENLENTKANLNEIVKLNEVIVEKWNDKFLWNDEFRAMCRRYDVLYDSVMEGNRSDLLRLYCVEEIQNYVENALILEGDDNTERRMIAERKLFTTMEEKARKLAVFINDLTLESRVDE